MYRGESDRTGEYDLPEPVIGIAVEPLTQKDTDKLGMALAKLAEEDPTFRVKTDERFGSDRYQRNGRAPLGYYFGPSETRVQGRV